MATILTMTETIQKIDINIPDDLLSSKGKDVNYSLIRGRTVVGLCGYAKSGKDTIGKQLVARLGFKRIGFGDCMKQDLNEHMKHAVHEHLQERGISIEPNEDMDFTTNEPVLKEILRPYMQWFGEEMRRLNGPHYWTNRALETLTDTDKKIVITDIRRIGDMEMFKANREFIRKRLANRKEAGVPHGPTDEEGYDCDFESLLIHVNKFGHTDTDQLTIKAITHAYDQWLFDHIVQIDSRLPAEYHEKHAIQHVRKMSNLFPEYFV